MENSSPKGEVFQNARVRELADQIEELKKRQEVGVKYMRLWEEMAELKKEAIEEGLAEGREEGRAEGFEQAQIQAIRKFMKNMDVSMEKAMEVLEITENEREKYRQLVENQE